MFICEKCGKEHDGSFGSGRFCSKSCANSRVHSEETKKKIGSSCKIALEQWRLKNPGWLFPTLRVEDARPLHKLVCCICGKTFYSKCPDRKTCSRRCSGYAGVVSRKQRGTFKWGGENPNSRKSKFGFYDNIRFASTYELVYYIYCKDHGINISRNTDVFSYEYEGSLHKYTPDFKHETEFGAEYVEIKGYFTNMVSIKAKSVQDAGYSISVKYESDLRECFEYVSQKYGCGKNYKILYQNRNCT